MRFVTYQLLRGEDSGVCVRREGSLIHSYLLTIYLLLSIIVLYLYLQQCRMYSLRGFEIFCKHLCVHNLGWGYRLLRRASFGITSRRESNLICTSSQIINTVENIRYFVNIRVCSIWVEATSYYVAMDLVLRIEGKVPYFIPPAMSYAQPQWWNNS